MKKIVVFTGAGVSADSGLATFRDSDGLWASYRIEDVCTPEALAHNRAMVIGFYNMRRREMLAAQPNAGHEAIAGLEVASRDGARRRLADLGTIRMATEEVRPRAILGGRHGVNDYTAWFAGDESMKGDYHGYDGPCPPWNDEMLHHYVFTLYALDVARCAVEGRFTGPDVRAAITGHVLAEAKLTGTYSLNPALAAR